MQTFATITGFREGASMRKVILQEIVSLDGYAAGPNGDVNFIPESTRGDQRWGAEQSSLMDRVDTLLLGRVTYDFFSQFWPAVNQGEEKEFADKFNGLSKVVFSRTLQRAPWGNWGEAKIVRGNPADEVAKLKTQPGKDMLISGSISIGHALSEANAVDEYHVIVCPVVLGGGRALFRGEAGGKQLELIDSHSLNRGAVSLLYRQRS
jgi:dihydrofolate reductase